MSAGNPLTDLTNAIVKRNAKTLYGKVMSRPAQLVTDGKNVIWACDVDVGITDPSGLLDQTQLYLQGVPGTTGFQVSDTLTTGTVLRNVPISRNNDNLLYADVGNPVILQRSESGQWEITGFSQEMTGTRTRVAVDMDDMTIGEITDLTISGRMLTLGEYALYGGTGDWHSGTSGASGWGIIPLGASGVFVGGVLKEIVG